MSSPVRFRYRLTGTGWSEGRLVVGDEFVDATASYLSDALADLLRAVIEIADGASTARASWYEEPGEYRWIFDRGHDSVRIQTLWFDDDMGRPPDAEGDVRLDAPCRIDDLVAAVTAGTREVLALYGAQGYEAKWLDNPFPAAELRALEDRASTGDGTEP